MTRMQPFVFGLGLAGILAVHVRDHQPHSVTSMVCITVLTIAAMMFATAGDADQREIEDDPPAPP